MISRRIPISPQNDSYGRLASYIAAIGSYNGRKEKPALVWCSGCAGGDDYAEGIEEVKDTQAQNTRAWSNKTYHLVISFRPEDAPKLTQETLRDIERRFAAELGLAGHQRHCAFHVDTQNPHLQIAYNLIHPEKLTRHEPFRDYRIRNRLCRELEQEYCLTVDNGRSRAGNHEKAIAVEAQRGQQSFASYALERRDSIVSALDAAQSWCDFHTELARHGLEIKPKGNGLTIKDRHGKHAIKASAVDRSLSMKKLEARFGAYSPAQGLEHVQELSRYQAAPLHRAPERGNLFAEYRQAIADRKVRLEAVKEREDAALAAIREQWAAKRKEIEAMGIAKKNRRNLLSIARKHEADAVAGTRLAMQPEREAVRRDVPFTDWIGFLRHKAKQGSEVALAVLRSRRESVAEEKEAAPKKDWTQHGREQFFAAKVDYAARERAALELEGVSGKAKKRLLAVLRMERLAAEESGLSGFQHTVDNKGAVVFALPGGGIIRDQGKELFSSGDEQAKKTALLYARSKWGKNFTLDGNRIVRESEPVKEQIKGMER